MNILFVYDNMYAWGGIQTLLLRLAPELRARRHEVALLTRPRGEPHDATGAIVEQISRHATIHMAEGDWLDAPASLRGLALPHADVIVACDLRALLLTSVLHRHTTPTARVLACAYSPREYGWKPSVPRRRWVQHLGRRIVNQLPVENLLFASDGMAAQTGNSVGRDLSQAAVLPVPIDIERFQPNPDRRVDRRKIAAVARLVPMYAHHLQMIRVIRDLRDGGHDFQYHAYGEGEDRPVLEAEALRLGVEDSVTFHGAIPYERFTEAVDDAFVFIGHGTSLLEAAACGVPALVGVGARQAPATYGFLQDMVGRELGGIAPDHPEFQISERVLWLADQSDANYRQVAAASRARAEEFAIDRLMPRFLEIVGGTLPFSVRVSQVDRLIASADRVLAAVLWKLGVDTSQGGRYAQTVSPEELDIVPKL